ncbi:SpaH/EbpB family LPXTG-anchored major pilin [uncultured Subdoligranulum sp.]|uniref:SpaH/EbpB family LPXTG-anchored major pilin n=1 Tax=uncultured Subdoligranulum sp. TaxID=512298 RepID=UPI0025F9B723|nr:SpaH/EbpB family LPXTG-anchored major pilin [uncultured Subdoligranulum sp.]
MKHKLKALASLCLALALTLCLTLPAWAAGDGDAGQRITEQTKGSIKVSGVESGVKVHVYQLMDVNVDAASGQPKMPVYSWVTPVGDWLKGNETYKEYISSDGNDYSVTDNFTLPENDVDGTKAAEIAAFYDSLAAAIRGGTAIQNFQPTETKTVEKNQTECTISGLPMGNYLVLIEGGMKIYRPSAVNLVPVWQKGEDGQDGEWVISSPAEVAIKSSEPTIIKKVKDAETYDANDNVPELDYAQVDIGDTVTYILEADVPQFPADAINKGYQISDILPAGMTLNAATVEVFGGDENGQGTVIDENEYNLNSTDATRPEGVTEDADTKTVDFSITFKNIINIRESYSKIKITYTATANEKIAVVENNGNTTGNQNTAYLDYNNNPYEKKADETLTWQTDYDTATVYTYGIKVDKKSDTKEGGQDVYLPGAEFTLTKKDGATPIHFVYTGGTGTTEGTYRVATQAEINETGKTTTTLTVGNENSVNNKGKLTLSGLDVDVYILTETKAPAGYNLLSQPKEFTITDAKDNDAAPEAPEEDKNTPDGIIDNKNAGDNNSTGYISFDVINTQGFTLPTTGGMGTVLFTAGGVVLMGAGLVLLVVFLRRRRAK